MLTETKSRTERSGTDVTPRLLRTRDAAEYLGLSDKAIRHLIIAGRLPYVQLKPGNSPFLLDRFDLDKFIEANKVPVVRM